jgi:hypothetical protein
MKCLFSFLGVIALTFWLAAYDCSYGEDIRGQDAEQITAVGHSITSGLTSVPGSSRDYSSPLPQTRDSVEGNLDGQSLLQQYVTPEDQAIKILATQISETRDAYQMAVQWTYVSDQKLNQAADKWLTPHEFLTDTPHYSSNPLQGEIVSDCEEKANTLVSLIRAEGVRPEEVRVVLGEVEFNNVKMGHAWVELLTGGHWLALDPNWGPYWDEEAEKLVKRRGFPFDYYASHTYPVIQVWTYYNDTYYLEPKYGSGLAPASWEGTDPAKLEKPE